MSRDRDRDEPFVPSWDGEVASWPEYNRRVRLCYAQLPKHKRYTLGPKLVLRLRGKAWEVAASIDHANLSRRTGTQYLMNFLKSRLGRLPVPDIGQHLEDLFVRLRRAPGTDMVSWCNQLREAYRKVQRSLARAKPGCKDSGVQTDLIAVRTPPTSPTSTSRRAQGSEPAEEPSRAASDEHAAAPADPGVEQHDDEAHLEEDEWEWGSHWSGWGWSEWSLSRQWKEQWQDEDGDWEEDDEYQWEDDELLLPSILPEEVLGWILMRRSGLPASAKLNIQAASGNSLKLSDVERAMRQQEDELMVLERQKQTPQKHPRSYWVEHEGSWGVMLVEPDEFDPEKIDQVHWVEDDVAKALFSATDDRKPEVETAWYNDGYYDWFLQDGEWMAQSAEGWVSYADVQPWYDIEEVMVADATAGQELHDLYAAYDQKLRTFKEAREAVHQKAKGRGFFPSKGLKGKSKGTPKGKKGSVYGMTFGNHKGKGTGNPSSVPQKPGNPGYTGCFFFCGSETHDFRSCPRRGQSGASSSKTRPVHYVDTAIEQCFMVQDVGSPSVSSSAPRSQYPSAVDVQRLILAAADVKEVDPTRPLTYAVIDTGATETVGSLEAVEQVMMHRQKFFPQETVGVNPNKKKRFKLGNAQECSSESFVLLPQCCGGQGFSLGVYTLDVGNVPILIGARTLSKLGASICVRTPELMFNEIFPGVRIPLVKGTNGHLLLDLGKDWSALNQNVSMDVTLPPCQNPESKKVSFAQNGSGETHHSEDVPMEEPLQQPCQFQVEVVDDASDSSMSSAAEHEAHLAQQFPPPAGNSRL